MSKEKNMSKYHEKAFVVLSKRRTYVGRSVVGTNKIILKE